MEKKVLATEIAEITKSGYQRTEGGMRNDGKANGILTGSTGLQDSLTGLQNHPAHLVHPVLWLFPSFIFPLPPTPEYVHSRTFRSRFRPLP